MNNKLTRCSVLALSLQAAFGGSAWANPGGAQVAAGQASIEPLNAHTLQITNTPGAIINWRDFSIGAGELTRFVQQSADSTVLNRVVGADASQILGQLQSNGRVFLINPNGILIGRDAVIDTADFLASTLNVTDQDFIAGKLNWFADGPAGRIENQGIIRTGAGGRVLLIAPDIENSGIIEAEGGKLILAAGRKLRVASLDLDGVEFEVQAPADAVVNLGRLIANGGAIQVLAGTIRHSGEMRANALVRNAAGEIELTAQGDLDAERGSRISALGPEGGRITLRSSAGTTRAGGAIDATGSEGRGGTVEVLGARVSLGAGADIDVSGSRGGGVARIGGDFRGANPQVQNAARSFVAAGASIRADATGAGDGGKVIVWADEVTRYFGSASARGGARGGNGGLVEISGKRDLAYRGRVDLRAPAGAPGTLLFDPRIGIVAAAGGAVPELTDEFADLPANVVTIDPAALDAVGGNVFLLATESLWFLSPITLTTPGAGLSAEAGALRLGANIVTAGGAVSLTASTGSISRLTTAPVSITTGGGALSLNVPAGSVDFGITGNAGTGAVALSAAGSLNGSFTGGAVTASGRSGVFGSYAGDTLALSSDSGPVSATVNASTRVDAASPTSSIFLSASGALPVGTMSGNSVTLSAGGAIAPAGPSSALGAANQVTLTSGAHIASAAAPLAVTAPRLALNAATSFNVDWIGTPVFLSITARTAGLGATSAIRNAALPASLLSASGSTMTLADLASPLSGGFTLNVVDGALTVGSLAPGSGFVNLTARDTLTLGAISAPGGASVRSTAGAVVAAADTAAREIDAGTAPLSVQAATGIGTPGFANPLDVAGASVSLRTTGGTVGTTDPVRAATPSLTVDARSRFNVDTGTTPLARLSIFNASAAGMGAGGTGRVVSNGTLYQVSSTGSAFDFGDLTPPAGQLGSGYAFSALDGDLRLGLVQFTTGGLSLATPGAVTHAGAMTLGVGSLVIDASGDVSLGQLSGGFMDIASDAALSTGAISSSSSVELRGNTSVTVTGSTAASISAAGPVQVNASFLEPARTTSVVNLHGPVAATTGGVTLYGASVAVHSGDGLADGAGTLSANGNVGLAANGAGGTLRTGRIAASSADVRVAGTIYSFSQIDTGSFGTVVIDAPAGIDWNGTGSGITAQFVELHAPDPGSSIGSLGEGLSALPLVGTRFLSVRTGGDFNLTTTADLASLDIAVDAASGSSWQLAGMPGQSVSMVRSTPGVTLGVDNRSQSSLDFSFTNEGLAAGTQGLHAASIVTASGSVNLTARNGMTLDRIDAGFGDVLLDAGTGSLLVAGAGTVSTAGRIGLRAGADIGDAEVPINLPLGAADLKIALGGLFHVASLGDLTSIDLAASGAGPAGSFDLAAPNLTTFGLARDGAGALVLAGAAGSVTAPLVRFALHASGSRLSVSGNLNAASVGLGTDFGTDLVIGNDSAAVAISSSGDQSFNSGRDLIVKGGNATGASVSMTSAGSQSFGASGRLSFLGGSGTDSAVLASAGAQQFLGDAGMLLQAGTAPGASVLIDGQSQFFESFGDLSLVGGSGAAGNAADVLVRNTGAGQRVFAAGTLRLTGGSDYSGVGLVNAAGAVSQDIQAASIVLETAPGANTETKVHLENLGTGPQDILSFGGLLSVSNRHSNGEVAVRSAGDQFVHVGRVEVEVGPGATGSAGILGLGTAQEILADNGTAAEGAIRVRALGPGMAAIEAAGTQSIFTYDETAITSIPPRLSRVVRVGEASGTGLSFIKSGGDQQMIVGSLFVQAGTGDGADAKVAAAGVQIISALQGGISVTGGTGTTVGNEASIDPALASLVAAGPIDVTGGSSPGAVAGIFADTLTVISTLGNFGIGGGGAAGASASVGSNTSALLGAAGDLGLSSGAGAGATGTASSAGPVDLLVGGACLGCAGAVTGSVVRTGSIFAARGAQPAPPPATPPPDVAAPLLSLASISEATLALTTLGSEEAGAATSSTSSDPAADAGEADNKQRRRVGQCR